MNRRQLCLSKVKAINKLVEAGYETEKDLQNLTMDKILALPNITLKEIMYISEIQRNCKIGKLYSYLGSEDKNADKAKDVNSTENMKGEKYNGF